MQSVLKNLLKILLMTLKNIHWNADRQQLGKHFMAENHISKLRECRGDS